MSETADELDRLAEEFDKSRQDQQDRCAKAMESGAVHAEVTARARAGTLEDVVNRLRERAEEMRAQRSGPTYKPQPKPAEVKAGQWWAFDSGPLRRVVGVYPDGHDRCASFGAPFVDEYVNDMLSSSLWMYLGDDYKPAR